MTRAERLAEQEARAKTRLEAERKKYAEAQQKRRAEDMRKRAQRYTTVGKLLDDAGLLSLSDADLAALVQLLTSMMETPNPVAVLAGLLRAPDTEAVVLGPGDVPRTENAGKRA